MGKSEISGDVTDLKGCKSYSYSDLKLPFIMISLTTVSLSPYGSDVREKCEEHEKNVLPEAITEGLPSVCITVHEIFCL